MLGSERVQGISQEFISMMLQSIKDCMDSLEVVVLGMAEMRAFLFHNMSKEETT